MDESDIEDEQFDMRGATSKSFIESPNYQTR